MHILRNIKIHVKIFFGPKLVLQLMLVHDKQELGDLFYAMQQAVQVLGLTMHPRIIQNKVRKAETDSSSVYLQTA